MTTKLLLLSAFCISDTLPRRGAFWGGVGVGYGLIYALPAATWYKWREAQGWRFFNDGLEWRQMDKLGHVWTTYHLSLLIREWAKKNGYSQRQAYRMGGSLAWLFQLSIEAFDGFFPKWGASLWDVAANTAGTALYMLSQALQGSPWQVGMRFSFHPTPYAKQKPHLLGRGVAQILKDYNGQTYWFCIFHRRSPIGLALGHGAEGLLGGYGQEPEATIRERERRRWVLSVDPHWEVLFRKSHWFVRIFVSFKTPLPALVYVAPKARFVWLYY
ncbi:MAG: DUF2279 domain-containing protein [Bacteroidia bacterium]|nr:YfiM family protein [Bacteroidia bacterium]MDW8133552.1 DUF2279 domain-containing protein [Bacteroidia bacterium]